ncbi:MAG TPA: alpha-L-arabinofuranosidase C-terminal domain-containing protein [Puia sp.]|jgi:alpha-N-arabinofuranosidase|nr:alpha-L-arabinofuranosidase C-terminal domain-containing protein [Puia sp.]
MKKFNFILTALFVLSSSGLLSQAVTVLLHVTDAKTVINKNIYGHFAEHLGHCIYNGLYIGDSSLVVPNTDGVRNDIITALKKLKVPVLRWPGGCFADTYHWKDGIGPRKERPTMINKWWGGVTEDNSFGTHDFLNLCERISADPYLAGNVGSGTVQELSQWVQYVNGEGISPMSSWRKANGRDKPWHVKYFGVGNEAWGCGGNMSAEYYSNIYRQYATFMTDWSNSDHLFRVGSGANADDYHWTEVMMRDVPKGLLEGVSLHYYSVIDWNAKGPAVDFSLQQYFATMKQALRMEELVTKHEAVMDKYDPQKKLALVVDEWGGWYDVEPGSNPFFLYQQNTMRDAMLAGVTLNIFNNHCDRVRMANLAQLVNVLQSVILTNKQKIILTPTYHVMEMYNVHQDAMMIPVSLSSNLFYSEGNDSLPAISVSASRDKQGITHISLVNIDPGKSNLVLIKIQGALLKLGNSRILKSARIQDHNSFDEPDKIFPQTFLGATIKNNELNVSLPPASVVVLTLL